MKQYILKILDESSIIEVQKVFEASPKYSLNVEGNLPSVNAANKAFLDIPPNFSREFKYCLGFYEDRKLIGFIDVLNGYPDKEIAYLGLLLLDESFFGKGLGTIAFKLLEEKVRAWGSKKIRLSVAKTNDVAEFWRKMGFFETGRVLNAHDPKIISQVIEMDKILSKV